MILSKEHAAVETMIAIGVPFEYIEDYINALSLSSEQRGALWLLAWAEATDPAQRRRIVAQTLAYVGQVGEPAGDQVLPPVARWPPEQAVPLRGQRRSRRLRSC